MVAPFIWASASPVERAMWVRDHYHRFGEAKTRELFDLPEAGIAAIMAGAAWKTDYENPAVNYL